MRETNISHIIKELRVLKAAAIETRTKEEYEELRRKHVLKAYSSLDSDNQDSQRDLEDLI